jgi:hypothetical protein
VYNDNFPDADYHYVKNAKVETYKVFSPTIGRNINVIIVKFFSQKNKEDYVFAHDTFLVHSKEESLYNTWSKGDVLMCAVEPNLQNVLS